MMSFEERQEWGKKMREEKEALNKKMEEIRKEELKKQGICFDTYKDITPQYDSPYALENGEATVLWLIVAIGAFIFKDGWMISIIATIIWLNHIIRHINVDGGNN